jgi:hypothetical protein
MGKSLCKRYVTWFNHESQEWATWAPGALVTPGDVGNFNREKKFSHPFTLKSFGIYFELSEETPSGSRTCATEGSLDVAVGVKAEVPDPVAAVANLSGRVRVTSNHANAAILQVLDTTTQHVINADEVLQAISRKLLNGEWRVDAMVVMERVRVERGFAAIFTSKGQSLELEGAADIGAAGLPVVGASLELVPSHTARSFSLTEFSPGETPIFSSAIRIRKDLWTRLIPGLNNWAMTFDGVEWPLDDLPWNLDDAPEELTRYNASDTDLPIEVLSVASLGDLFEVVTELPDESTPRPLGGGRLESSYAAAEWIAKRKELLHRHELMVWAKKDFAGQTFEIQKKDFAGQALEIQRPAPA